jgi:hypothetical protein
VSPLSSRGRVAGLALLATGGALAFHAQSCAADPVETDLSSTLEPPPVHGDAGADANPDADASAAEAGPVELCPSSECPKPYADCNQDLADGCEVNLSGDPENCGACGFVCPTGADLYPPACNGGACVATCESADICGEVIAFGDCNGDPLDGCEAVLTSDATNCGSCGIECPADVPCVDGHCGCIGDEVPCGDSCADLGTDAMHCGSCGHACPDPDLTDDQLPRCNAGQCTLGCQEQCGLFDCDGDPATPCVDVGSASAHCGACGHACAGDAPCNGGVCCDPATLEADVANCGGCGNHCWDVIWSRIWETNGDVVDDSFVPSCEGGTCAASCAAPWLDCNADLAEAVTDGCETNGARDQDNCGACGVQCLDGQLCLLGACATKPCEEVAK